MDFFKLVYFYIYRCSKKHAKLYEPYIKGIQVKMIHI